MTRVDFSTEQEAKGYHYILNNVAGRLLPSHGIRLDGVSVYYDEIPDSVIQYVQSMPDYELIHEIGKFPQVKDFIVNKVEPRFDSASDKINEIALLKNEVIGMING